MFTGFEKIVEERIRRAQLEGAFENLPGAGRPLELDDDQAVPEDLRLAYKILRNAGCLPPEIEITKEIRRTEDLLEGVPGTTERYRALKKLNFLILKLNSLRRGSAALDMPQRYLAQVTDRITAGGK